MRRRTSSRFFSSDLLVPLSLSTPDLIAFIDESGDEGFNYTPPPAKRGTEWIILSAVLTGWHDGPAIRRAYEAFKATRQPNWHFHFNKAQHDTRLGFIEHMVQRPLSCMTVLVHKPSLINRAGFSQPYTLYLYAAQMLIERISWRASQIIDNAQPHGGVQLAFSTRRGLTRPMIIGKLGQLKAFDQAGESVGIRHAASKIDWSVINVRRTSVSPNESSIGLQYADAVASGAAKAVEFSEYGTTEHRYIKMLKPVIYRHSRYYFSYGLKFFPSRPDPASEARFGWLRRFE